jgi:hypothetical protein
VIEVKERIITRRGKPARNIAKVAAARRMLEVVFYVMRDGDARCLHQGYRDGRNPDEDALAPQRSPTHGAGRFEW